MAIQPPSIYYKMQEVFEKYENGELKKQKLRSRKSDIGKKKFMQGHYSAKVQHFKVFQGLKVRVALLVSFHPCLGKHNASVIFFK